MPLGATLRDIGEFGNGGLLNNLEITFVTRPSRFADALELHENKAIKVLSDKLTGYNDPNGDPFEYFIVKRLERTDEGDLIVTAQAWLRILGERVRAIVRLCRMDRQRDCRRRAERRGRKLTTVSPTLGATSTTYSSSIDTADVVTSRWVHTIDALPPANSYNVWHPTANIGFKVWHDGSGWIYHQGGIDTTTFTAGSGAQTTLAVLFDKNGGSPVRYFQHNGRPFARTAPALLRSMKSRHGFVSDRMTIGDIFWEVYPCGCTPTPRGSLQNGTGLDAVFITEDGRSGQNVFGLVPAGCVSGQRWHGHGARDPARIFV